MNQVNIDTSQVLLARQNLRELREEMAALTEQQNRLKESGEQENAVFKRNSNEINNLKNRINELNTEINELDANGLTQSFEDIYGSIQPLSGQIGELEDRLYQMAAAGQTGTAEFEQMIVQVSQMRGVMEQTDAQIDAMTLRTKGIAGMGEAFGNVGTSLAKLDFRTAAQNMNTLNAAMTGGEKGLKGIFNGLKTATSGVKMFGAALLANPIFLIAAVVVGVAVTLYKLKDSLAFVQVAIDSLTAAFDVFMNFLKKGMDLINQFTDYLGLTNAAEQKAAEEAVKSSEKIAEAEKHKTEIANQGLQRKLENLKANGELNAEQIDQEMKLLNSILHNNKMKIKSDMDVIQKKIELASTRNNLTEEEKKELEDQKKALEKFAEDIKDINAEQGRNIQTAEKKKQDLIKKTNDARKASNDKAKQEEDKRLKEIADFNKKVTDMLQKTSELINGLMQESYIDSLTDTFDKRQAVLEYQLNNEKDKALQLLKEQEALIIANKNISDEERKRQLKKNSADVEFINTYYANKLTKELTNIEKERNDKINSINLEYDKLTEEQLAMHLEESEDINIAYENKRYENQLKALEMQRKASLDSLVEGSEEYIATKAKYDKEIENAEEVHNKNLNDIKKKWSDKTLAEQKETINKTGDAIANGFAQLNNEIGSIMSDLSGSITMGFDAIVSAMNNTEATSREKNTAIASATMAMAASVLGAVNSLLSDVAAKRQEELNRQLENLNETTERELELVSDQADAQNQIIDEQLSAGLISKEEADRQKEALQAETDQKMYELELAKFNKEEKLRKQAFEQDKKMKVAQATIGMIQGMLSAFAGAMSLGFPLGPIVGGVMAAAVGVMGAINIANIKKTKYQGGTPPAAPAPSINLGSLSSSSSSSNAPNLENTGMSSSTSQGQAVQQEVNVNSNVTVSVTELENTSNKVNKYKNNGEL